MNGSGAPADRAGPGPPAGPSHGHPGRPPRVTDSATVLLKAPGTGSESLSRSHTGTGPSRCSNWPGPPPPGMPLTRSSITGTGSLSLAVFKFRQVVTGRPSSVSHAAASAQPDPSHDHMMLRVMPGEAVATQAATDRGQPASRSYGLPVCRAGPRAGTRIHWRLASSRRPGPGPAGPGRPAPPGRAAPAPGCSLGGTSHRA